MTLLATFYMLIWSRSREEDLVIGVTSAGRGRSELEGMLGCFLNTVLLRTGVSGELTFAELVARCKDELFGALANDGLPFSLVVKELSGERDGSRHPLFQLLFSFEPPLAPLKPGWKFTRMDVETGSAKFDLHLELDEFPQGVEGRFIYNADLFDRSTIEQMGADWVGIVSEVVATPSRRISELVPSPRPQRQTLESRTEVAAAALPSQRSVGLLKSVRKLFSTR
jgi:non-ribosomal peptide synthetase component F